MDDFAQKITPDEIKELLLLKGWSKTRLAAEIGSCENAVWAWTMGRRNPRGPACVMMKRLLMEARKESVPPRRGQKASKKRTS